jgi:GTPase SAR1 family protein
MEQNTSIIIVGQPGTSKTTYLSQLVLQVQGKKKAIKFRNKPDDISILKDAITQLRNGEEVQATPSENNEIIKLPLSINGNEIDLICPDYAGEQISHLLESREIDTKWIDLIVKSDGWIIFVRPTQLSVSYDISTKSIQEAEAVKLPNNTGFQISDQSNLIELLQILRHYKKLTVQQEAKTPKLLVAFTCWDELDEKVSPLEYVQKQLPLFYEYIANNWYRDSFSFAGLSAQGGKIADVKEDYELLGPEESAYIVEENGGDNLHDLSLLLTRVL